MLSKCLNTICGEPFRYLRQGRIFHLEVPPSSGTSESRRREYFWLCGRCSATLTIVIKNGVATVQPRFLELPTGENMGQADQEVPSAS
jgi:hypothetical protein